MSTTEKLHFTLHIKTPNGHVCLPELERAIGDDCLTILFSRIAGIERKGYRLEVTEQCSTCNEPCASVAIQSPNVSDDDGLAFSDIPRQFITVEMTSHDLQQIADELDSKRDIGVPAICARYESETATACGHVRHVVVVEYEGHLNAEGFHEAVHALVGFYDGLIEDVYPLAQNSVFEVLMPNKEAAEAFVRVLSEKNAMLEGGLEDDELAVA
jgi:hypothetical protein